MPDCNSNKRNAHGTPHKNTSTPHRLLCLSNIYKFREILINKLSRFIMKKENPLSFVFLISGGFYDIGNSNTLNYVVYADKIFCVLSEQIIRILRTTPWYAKCFCLRNIFGFEQNQTFSNSCSRKSNVWMLGIPN
jgi:hypothetical protein